MHGCFGAGSSAFINFLPVEYTVDGTFGWCSATTPVVFGYFGLPVWAEPIRGFTVLCCGYWYWVTHRQTCFVQLVCLEIFFFFFFFLTLGCILFVVWTRFDTQLPIRFPILLVVYGHTHFAQFA